MGVIDAAAGYYSVVVIVCETTRNAPKSSLERV